MRVLTLLFLMLVWVNPALAQDHRHGGYNHGYNRGGYYGPQHYGNDLGAAIVGGAIGSVIGNIFNPPVVVIAPPVQYGPPVLVPWSPQWQSSCSIRYRSFDPSTGYYLGLDGNRHFCQ